MAGADTRFIHAARKSDAWHAPPLDFSTTYPIPDMTEAANSLHQLAHGAPMAPNAVYARLHNPTVARFEEALAAVEYANHGIAFATGMAAITATLLVASGRGKHIVAIRPLYGGTDHVLSSGFGGLEVTFATPENLTEALRDDTALVIMETPANPTLKLTDIKAVVEAAGDVPVMVDSTFATPVLQQPLELGATLVVHSATKYIGGHGDVMGGIVATNDEDWAASLRSMRAGTGGLLHPLGGYLLHRGLQTLPVRIEKAQSNAQFLVERLLSHPAVTAVHFPGLEDSQGLVGTQMSGPGAMVAFEVASKAAAQTVMTALQLITPAVSLGSTDTLLQHPASLTHQLVEEHDRQECGVSEGLLRLSVGLETVEDIWDDLAAALAMAHTRRRRRRRGLALDRQYR